jgi:Tol biopolymer transport system component
MQGRFGAGGMGEVSKVHDTKRGRDALTILPEHLDSVPDRLAAAWFILDDHGRYVAGGATAQSVSRMCRAASSLVAAATFAASAAGVLKSASVPSQPLARFTITLPTGDRFTNIGRHLVALSPDGTRLVYVANQQIYVRALNQLEAVPIRGTEGTGNAAGRSPFFSPDGQWVGFWRDGQLKKVSITGGAPVVLCPAQNPFGASWAADDNTVLYGHGAAGIWRVSGDGGKPENVVKVDAGQIAHGPQLLPGGRAVLFTLAGTGDWDAAQIVVQSLDTGKRHVVVEGGADARYVPSDHLVYAHGNTLLAVPFDAAALAVKGRPVPLVEDVARGEVTGAAQFGMSNGGVLVYVPTDAAGAAQARTLVWVDRQGREEPIKAPARPYFDPRLSPDGTRIALEIQDQERDIWVFDLARETLTRLTFGPAFDFPAIWTPDGRAVIFSSGRSGRNTIDPRHLFQQAVDGTGSVERLTQGDSVRQVPYAVTSDGTGLIFREHSTDPRADAGDLMLLPLKGERHPQPLVKTDFREMNAEISPDSRWLAYQSNESGRDEIYVVPFPNVTAGKWQVSASGGMWPLWARNGQELFYVSMGALMRVPRTMGSTFEAGTPSKLFDGPYIYGSLERAYDVSPDGRRFLMIRESGAVVDPAPSARLIVIQHWLEELRRRVPVK